MFYKFLFYVLLCFSGTLFSEYYYDGVVDKDWAQLLTSRTQQYPSKYRKIVLDTIPRTGSLFLYNVFRYLFEKTQYLDQEYKNFYMHPINDSVILFGHGCSEHIEDADDIVYFSSFRDPEQIVYSFVRASLSREPHMNAHKRIERCSTVACNHWKRLSVKAIRTENFHILLFDEFTSDLNLLLDQIESIFGIVIDQKDRENLSIFLSKSFIQSYLIKKGFINFDQVDPLSGFHGAHIDNASISSFEKSQWLNRIQQHLNTSLNWSSAIPLSMLKKAKKRNERRLP